MDLIGNFFGLRLTTVRNARRYVIKGSNEGHPLLSVLGQLPDGTPDVV